ncbi:MAG TPA: DUF6350 family protein [Mycobacteriales bacterium]|jgi:hypothetical protein|nr:DUF6350 family protein [Mycobacteriales bacterium]
MSDVLDRLRPRAAATSARSESVASVWVRGAFAATWVVAVGVAALVVLALVVWAADSQSTANAAGAMRLAAQLWLIAQRTPLRINGGALTIPPLGLTLLLALLLTRATAIVARASNCTERRELGIVITSVTAPYAVLATAIAALSPSSSIRPSVGAAFVCAVIVGGLSATTGAVRASGLGSALWRALPLDLRAAFDAVGAAIAVLVGAATVLTLGSLLAHGHEFWTTLRAYHGSAGEFSMLTLSLLLLPNAVMFSLAYLVGPGFAVGAGTSVALGGSHAGALPALPLLAAVPTGRAPLPVLVICVAAVVLAGVLAGWRLVRRPALGLANRVRSALLAGGSLGVGAAGLVGFGGGPAGPGRLSAVGPSPWQVGLTVAVEVSVISLIVVVAAAWAQLGRRTTAGR